MNAFRNKWERRLGITESPIESLWLEAFCSSAVKVGYDVWKTARKPNETIVIQPQRWIDQYRADFLISFSFFGSFIGVVVECDGHAFHEKTKGQASRDKRRDRTLQATGYSVFRFTGSEVHANAEKCADEVLAVIMDFQTGCIMRAFERARAA